MNRAAGSARGLDKAARETHAGLKLTAERLGMVSNYTGLAAVGVGAFLTKAIMAAGTMERLEVALESSLGKEGMQKHMAALKAIDMKSSLGLLELSQASMLMIGAGASASEAEDAISGLANAMAVSGMSADKFKQASNAISQIIGKGKLYGEELTGQLAEAGVPAAEVAKELGVNVADIGKAGISSADAIKAMIAVLSRGRFAGAAEKGSKTLLGSLDRLNSTYFQFLTLTGKPLMAPVIGAVNAVTSLLGWVQKLPGPVQNLIGLMGVGLVIGLGAASVAARIMQLQVLALARAHLMSATAAKEDAAAQALFGGAAAAAGGMAGKGATGVGAGAGLPGGLGGAASRGSKFAKMASGVGGKVGVGAFLASLGAGFLPEAGAGGHARRGLEGAGQGSGFGMLAGGAIGGIIGALGGPGGIMAGMMVGSRIGMGIGAAVGGIGGAMSGGPAAKAAPEKVATIAEKQLAAQEETNRLAKEGNDLLKTGVGSGLSLDTMPGARQAAALRYSLKIA